MCRQRRADAVPAGGEHAAGGGRQDALAAAGADAGALRERAHQEL